MKSPWALEVAFSLSVAALASVLAAWTWARHGRDLRRHFLFLVYLSIAVAYLQVGPALSLLVDDFEFGALPHAGHYALVQFLALAFFQVPLVLIYFGGERRDEPDAGPDSGRATPGDGRPPLRDRPPGAGLVCLGSIAFALAFLVVVARNGLYYTRLGPTGSALNVVNLPGLDFAVFRLYQDSCFFVAGVLFFLARWSRERPARVLAASALAAVLGCWGCWAMMNSRLMIVLGCLLLLGWWLSTSGEVSMLRKAGTFATAGLLGLYLLNIVMNIRRMGFEGGFRAEHLAPEFDLLGDSQGLRRLNGVDLMARLAPELWRQGPAWGAAWADAAWIVRRFVDPAGFDQYRLGLGTNAKNYLMWQYLGWEHPDYFSCTMTDFFGNFHALGFLAAAAILATLFRVWRRAVEVSRSGAVFVLALFFLTHAMSFDQEGVTLLFAWLKKLPVLAAVLVACPFAPAERPARAGSRAQSPPGTLP